MAVTTDLGVVVWTGDRVPGNVGERIVLLIEAGEGADMLDSHLGVHLDRAETLYGVWYRTDTYVCV